MLLPTLARDAVWKNYRVGQEVDKNPSEEYVRVTNKAIVWLWNHEQEQRAHLARLRAIE